MDKFTRIVIIVGSSLLVIGVVEALFLILQYEREMEFAISGEVYIGRIKGVSKIILTNTGSDSLMCHFGLSTSKGEPLNQVGSLIIGPHETKAVATKKNKVYHILAKEKH